MRRKKTKYGRKTSSDKQHKKTKTDWNWKNSADEARKKKTERKWKGNSDKTGKRKLNLGLEQKNMR